KATSKSTHTPLPPAGEGLSHSSLQETIIMEWLSEFGAIAAMQGFNGLSVFCVLLLMALGLAIIFGQMGVINMAHGEFLTIGAYTTFVVASLTEQFAPAFGPYYFFLAIALSFVIAGAIGWLVEWAMISKLYHRPLDTLLATWGLSLVMQQAFRSDRKST